MPIIPRFPKFQECKKLIKVQDLEIYKHINIHGFFCPEDPLPTDQAQIELEFERAKKWTKMLPGPDETWEKWERVMSKHSNKVVRGIWGVLIMCR
jgi:hypothetical protein